MEGDGTASTQTPAVAETLAASTQPPGRLDAVTAALPVIPPGLYEVLGEHGRGGLGRILRARDTRTGRVVAIKEMLASSTDAAQRFVREALITSNLQHPAIVPVYEIGRWPSGQPFYAMKLVDGETLADAIMKADSPAARLALLPHISAIADALAYTHREGVIHRDLKPQNVLIGKFGETVLIDWGLAKRGDEAEIELPTAAISGGHTVVGSVLGTPAYMAPEQARGEPVGVRADVYSIGAMLYHLLAGAPPYAGMKAQDIVMTVRDEPPAPLVEKAAWLPDDLRTIVDKAMARALAERYPSARELAEDLHRFTTGQLVGAHAYTRMQRLRRWIGRHRAALGVAVLAAVTLAVVGTLSVWRIMEARRRAVSGESVATARLAQSYEDRARGELVAERSDRALPLVVEARRLGRDTPANRFVHARSQVATMQLVAAHLIENTEITFAGTRVAITNPSGLTLWDPDRRAVVWQHALPGAVPAFANAALIIAGGNDAVVVLDHAGKQLAKLAWHGTAPNVIGLDAGVITAVAEDGRVALWNATTFAPLGAFSAGFGVMSAHPTNDARLVAVASSDGDNPEATAQLFEVASGTSVVTLCAKQRTCSLVQNTDAGLLLAERAVKGRSKIALADLTGQRTWEIEVEDQIVDLQALGAQFVVASNPGNLELRALADGAVVWSHRASTPIRGIKVVAGKRIVVTYERKIEDIDVASGTVLARYIPPLKALYPAISDDARRIAMVAQDGVIVSELSGPTVMLAGTGEKVRGDFTEDGRQFIAGDGTALITYDVASGSIVKSDTLDQEVESVYVTRDIVYIGSKDRVVARDRTTTAPLRTFDMGEEVARVAFSKDGARLAIGGASGKLRCWDTASGQPLGEPFNLPQKPSGLAWSPNAQYLAAIDRDANSVLWDAKTTAVRERTTDNYQFGFFAAFSPDSRHVVYGRKDPHPTIYALDGSPNIPLAVDGESISVRVMFSPAGDRLAMLGFDGRVHVLDATSGERRVMFDTERRTLAIAWSPDGALLATGDEAGALRVWDATIGVELASMQLPVPAGSVRFSSTGDALVAITSERAVLWRIPPAPAVTPIARCVTPWTIARGGLELAPNDAARCR